MARPAKPCLRAERYALYVYLNVRQIQLCNGKANRKEGYRKFLALDDSVPEVVTERHTVDRRLEKMPHD